MAGDDKSGVREEFLGEAQEIVESLSRDLLVLDSSQKEGQVDPDLINEVFRAVHTLKGIAGMFGYHQIGAVAHALEDLLDDLRLGRVELDQGVLDVLFDGVENFQRLLSDANSPDAESDFDLSKYAQEIDKVTASQQSQSNSLEAHGIDPNVLSVLTEYEEHRLRTNVEQGVPLYRLQVSLSLASIDSALEELKLQAKPVAEIITYLPSMGESDGDSIELDVILASKSAVEDLRDALAGPDAVLSPLSPGAHADAADRAEDELAIEDVEAAAAPAGTAIQAPQGAKSPASVKPPPGPKPPRETLTKDADQLSLRSVANTVRVDISKLDHLMNVVGELAIVRSSVSRLTERLRSRPELRQLALELHRMNRSFERHLEELQEGILDVRMVPLRQVFDKLARVVRQVAREHEKEIRLVVTGAETEVDKLIVEELSDPLMHIIRNCIDHGLEKPKVRELAGKPAVGTLALNAYQKGNHVLIEVEDDGAGMNEEVIVQTALNKGIVSPEARHDLTRDEILNLIFLPGFSTRSTITETSGRGVGMDVVKTNIARLGGVVDVQSEMGIGSKFTITLPITLAIISALVVRVARRTFTIPLTAVQEALLLDTTMIKTVEGREVVTLRGSTLPLCRLGRLFNLGGERAHQRKKQYVVVTSVANRRLGFIVDELFGQQDIVIKPLGDSLSGVRGFAGATDLGDQRVALVIDAPALLEEVLAGSEHAVRPGVSL